MNKDFGFTATVFGAGAGLFFLGYVLLEVPSNLALYRFGARLSFARIVICWGLLATASAFISGPLSFYTIRFLLGAVEAGFFPCVLFYLTLWFPKAYRGRIVSMFMTSIPVSVVIGAPLSSLLLKLDGAMSMRGWQWLFVIKGVPAVLLGVLVLFMLADKPADATWLSDEEKGWLSERLARERQQTDEAQSASLFRALANGSTLGLVLAYFGLVTCTVGISFCLPQIVKSLGLDNLQTGFVTAIPSVAALIGMVLIGRSSDHRCHAQSRRSRGDRTHETRRRAHQHVPWRSRGSERTRRRTAKWTDRSGWLGRDADRAARPSASAGEGVDRQGTMVGGASAGDAAYCVLQPRKRARSATARAQDRVGLSGDRRAKSMCQPTRTHVTAP
jgi:MFS family permease